MKHPIAGDRWMTEIGVRTITAVCMNALNSDRDDIRYTRIDGVKCKCSGRTFRKWAANAEYLGGPA